MIVILSERMAKNEEEMCFPCFTFAVSLFKALIKIGVVTYL